MTVVSKEITELKLLEQRMQALSTKDELTGLYNRRGFSDLADLDNLKTINDTHGRLAGDRTLKAAARVLTQACRESDILARLGGDEFAVLLADSEVDAAAGIVARIEQLIRDHNADADGGPALALSIGVGSCTGAEICSIDELIARADAAMYASKARRHVAPVGTAGEGTGD